MLQWHVALRDQVFKLEDQEVESLMLSATMEFQLEALTKKLQKFIEVMLLLQEISRTLRQVQKKFESVLDVHPTLCERLRRSGRISHSTSFEYDIVKIQEGRENDLNKTEKKLFRVLQIESVSENTEDVEPNLSIECAHKQLKISNAPKSSSYINLNYSFPTSNIRERHPLYQAMLSRIVGVRYCRQLRAPIDLVCERRVLRIWRRQGYYPRWFK